MCKPCTSHSLHWCKNVCSVPLHTTYVTQGTAHMKASLSEMTLKHVVKFGNNTIMYFFLSKMTNRTRPTLK